MNDVETYKLRCSLLGHSSDVRGVVSGETEGGKSFIVSGSRDRSSKIWMPATEGTGFDPFQSCEGHTNFVSCVSFIPPNPKHPKGLILTGGHDHTILGFELGRQTPVFRLSGHKGTVCSIAVTSDAQIVTGSWDQSAKIWVDQDNIATLTGHEAAVWAVATLPGDGHKILTGSADREIRLWIDYKNVKVFRGHTDCVRTLQVLDGEQFLSGSNDATIRLWNITQGETINTFYGHTNFIYSLALLPNGVDFVSVGEDRTLRIWKKSDCKQVIHLPSTSIWSVATMNNGDIITGSSDGTVRVFTSDPCRIADDELLAQFEKEVSQSTIAAQQDLGGMKISELPGPEILLREGKKDGDTKMVREGDKVACYAWSSVERKWNKVGDVVGASGATQNTSGKVLHEGKEYDYVFTVELDEAGGSLKLPYNITEDPWFAAQKFIDKNNLSQLFLDQVANFILTNTKGMQLGVSNNSNFEDPFTGGNRYVPDAASVSQPGVGGGGGIDPFTGSGAYTTAEARNSSSQMDVSAPAPETFFPVKDFLRFAQAPNYEALTGKLTDFLKSFGDGPAVVEEKVEALLSVGKVPVWSSKVELLVQNCLGWPVDKVFPILDLIRLGVLTPKFCTAMNQSITICKAFPEKFLSQDNATNQMLTMRILCNAFEALTSPLMENRSFILSQVLSNLCKGKNNQIAAATLVLNYSIVVTGRNSEFLTVESQTEILMTALSLIEMIQEPEAVFRLLVCIGNLVSDNKTMNNLFRSLGGDSAVNSCKASSSLSKIQQCALQITNCL